MLLQQQEVGFTDMYHYNIFITDQTVFIMHGWLSMIFSLQSQDGKCWYCRKASEKKRLRQIKHKHCEYTCMCVWTHRLHKLKFFPLLHLLDLEHVLQRRIVKHLPVLTHLWISLLQRTDTSHLCHTKKKKTGVFGQRKNTSLYLMQLRLLLFGGNAEVFLQNWVVSLCLLIKLFLSLLAEMRGGRKQQNKKREICFRRRQKGTSKHEIYWICTIPKQLHFYIYAYSRKWPMKRQSSNSYKETVI